MAHPDTLPDLLLGHGIRLKRYTPGYNEPHAWCPKCEGGSTGKDLGLSVTIDDDGLGATWVCHRGTCRWTGGGRLSSGQWAPQERKRPIQKPPVHPPSITESQLDWVYQFFFERKIGARTVDAFGCYGVMRHFGELGERPAIVFPYISNGEVVNRKYRPIPEKQPQQQERDALQTLFNIDGAVGSEEIVWVEGEPDVMALFECGIEHGVSLKDGAGQAGSKSEKRFEALRTHADMLERAKRIILAGDNDEPGFALQEELARRLGRHRCRIVTWPDGCKDACDVLRLRGPDAVIAAIRSAEPYPIDGLQRITRGTLMALRRRKPPEVMTTGTKATDDVLKLPKEGRLIIVTGIPSHGKTSWTRFVAVHTAKDEDRVWAVFSPEMQPWEHFVAECAEVYTCKPFWPSPHRSNMTEQDIVEAEIWLADKLTMIVSDSEDKSPTLDWVMDRARSAVLRDGATDVLIDPWNEIEHQRGTMSETDYIGRGLQRLKAFALRHGCNIWVVVHPAKPLPTKPGEKRQPPGPYDLHGSAHWANKADVGITIHSPQTGTSELHLWKTRQRRWGKRGSVATMLYDELVGVYSSPLAVPGVDTYAPHWMDQDE